MELDKNILGNKRKDALSWDEFFIGIAKLAAGRSKDPSTQVGACIVNQDKKIVGIGYNGFPTGINDDEFPWNRDGDVVDSKYAYVTHSELNAILNYRGGSLEGTKLYVTLFPCNECAKAIIQAGITELVYADDKYNGTPTNVASRRMLKAAGIKMTPYKKGGHTAVLEL